MGTKLIYCVDGGGTATRARLYSADGVQLCEAHAGPCNLATDPSVAAGNVLHAWKTCADAIGYDAGAVEMVSAVIGAAGTLAPRSRVTFDALLPAFGTYELITDGYAALIGAGAGQPGGLVIAGTGAVAHRLLADGRSIQRDGFGWAGGDRGSGFWIGRRVLRHGVRALEGLTPETALSRRLFDQIGGYPGLLDMIATLRPTQVAALAPLAVEASATGCAAAREIMDDAIGELAALVGLLDLPQDSPLYFMGGLADALKGGLEDRLGRAFDTPQADAIEGCRLIAIGQAPREIMAAVGYPDPALVAPNRA